MAVSDAGCLTTLMNGKSRIESNRTLIDVVSLHMILQHQPCFWMRDSIFSIEDFHAEYH